MSRTVRFDDVLVLFGGVQVGGFQSVAVCLIFHIENDRDELRQGLFVAQGAQRENHVVS